MICSVCGIGSAYEAFGPAERAVLAATDDVVRDGAVSAESWAACEHEFGADQAVLDRTCHRDRRVANGRVDPAQPGGSVGGRRGELAAGRSTAVGEQHEP